VPPDRAKRRPRSETGAADEPTSIPSIAAGHDTALCLGEHVTPHLENVTRSGGRPHQYRARCPAHDDRSPSLSIGIGERGQIIWHCHARCTEADVRAAMIRRGVPDGCLRRVRDQRTEDELVSTLIMILEKEPPGPARDLMIAAAVWHDGEMPAGAELIMMGMRAGLSRRTIFRVTASARLALSVTRDGSCQIGTGSARLALSVTALTSGFAASVTPVVPYSVTGEAPTMPLLSVTLRRCHHCDRDLDPDSRSHAKYCSNRCRSAAHRRKPAQP
jgi:hypothetical protein